MMKPSRRFWLTAIAVAVAFHVARANAAMEDYMCYKNQLYYLAKAKHLSHVNVTSLEQCLELCDSTAGCVSAVLSQAPSEKTPTCMLFEAGNTPALFPWPYVNHGLWMVLCAKKTKYPKAGDTPQTHQEFPPKIPHEQYRQQPKPPTPQPSQTPGGRR